MSDVINWGILSPGRIAHNFAQATAVIDHANVVAVASSSADKASDFAVQYNIPFVFVNYAELLACQQVDCVYIASVHSMHAEQALSCLEKGIPVVIEKPITVNSKQLATLIDLAGQKNVFLMEALWTRFLPVTEQVRAWLSEGMIGQLQHVKSSLGFKADVADSDRLKNPQLAGGVLLDLGIYPIAMSQYFSQSAVNDIQASAIIGNTGVDEELRVKLSYSNGVTAAFDCSIRQNYANCLRLEGSDGHITMTAPFWGATSASLYTNGKTTEFAQAHEVNGFEHQIRGAMQVLSNDATEADNMTWADSLENMRVMDSIRDSIGVHYPFE